MNNNLTRQGIYTEIMYIGFKEVIGKYDWFVFEESDGKKVYCRITTDGKMGMSRSTDTIYPRTYRTGYDIEQTFRRASREPWYSCDEDPSMKTERVKCPGWFSKWVRGSIFNRQEK